MFIYSKTISLHCMYSACLVIQFTFYSLQYTFFFFFLILQISEEWSKSVFVIKPGDEDIHTANERRLKVR